MEKLDFVRDYKPKVYSGPTSMVSLIIPPDQDLVGLRQRMKKELQTANNIKSNTNRKSVKSSISNICERLNRMKSIPSTGIALYSEQYV